MTEPILQPMPVFHFDHEAWPYPMREQVLEIIKQTQSASSMREGTLPLTQVPSAS
jgi:hypothetical protein